MQRIFLLVVISVCTLISLPTFSFAADQYAYRAGQLYLKSVASNYSECEAQCRGDAACRGWNFIKPNPRSLSGICEFNARKATPVSSPISISGEINTSIDYAMSRAVPMSSGNTVRVGTPIMPKRVVVKRPVSAPQIANRFTNTPQRIIKNAPVENIIRAPIPAGYKPISQVNSQPRTGQVQPRSMTRQQIYNEQMLAAQKRTANQTPKIQQASRAPIMPLATSNQQPLFGSLHDDLTQGMTPVPRPQTAPDRFGNPDAPIATSRAVPAVPVQTAPLVYPVISGQQLPSQNVPRLAGGH